MKKILVILAALSLSSVASADLMLNGIGYDADQLCHTGSDIVAQVTKSRDMYRENGQGDLIVVGTVTVNAGDSFNFRNATAYNDNAQGDSVPVHFDRNGNPMVIDVVTTGSDGNETTVVTKTPVPSC